MTTMTQGEPSYDVVVLGSGVLGLSIATRLVEAGVRVAIVARDLPEDIHSAAFASPWAGADWASVATNPAERRRDTITWNEFGKLSQTRPDLVTRTLGTQYFAHGTPVVVPWFKEICPDLHEVDAASLPPGIHGAIRWTTFTLNPPAYIAYLAENLRAHGVPLIRHRVSSIDEAAFLPSSILPSSSPPRLVVNATGLGSRTLLGVTDPLVHPARGQTVLVRAPEVVAYSGTKDASFTDGDRMYVIPRPGSGGLVVLGGTYRENDYSTLADPETAMRILKRAVRLVPELVPAEKRGAGDGQGEEWEKVEIVAHNVGLRPARTGGMRLEVEVRGRKEGKGQGLVPISGKGEGEYAVLHAYGIGGAGYQASLGIAEEAKDLALEYLANSVKLAT